MNINAKKLVELQLSRYRYEKSLTNQQKIDSLLDEMKFNVEMYEKHRKAKGNRFDRKMLISNQWTLIDRIEHIKNQVKREINA
jgi:hypothetical protein